MKFLRRADAQDISLFLTSCLFFSILLQPSLSSDCFLIFPKTFKLFSSFNKLFLRISSYVSTFSSVLLPFSRAPNRATLLINLLMLSYIRRQEIIFVVVFQCRLCFPIRARQTFPALLFYPES